MDKTKKGFQGQLLLKLGKGFSTVKLTMGPKSSKYTAPAVNSAISLLNIHWIFSYLKIRTKAIHSDRIRSRTGSYSVIITAGGTT